MPKRKSVIRNTGQCIVIICPHSSYRLGPYLHAAKQLGVPVVVVSQGKYSLVSDIASGVHVDFSDPQQVCSDIIAAVEDNQVAAVLGIDDATVEIAAQVSAVLGLPHNDIRASRFTRRKDLARDVMQSSFVCIPEYCKVSLQSLIDNPQSTIAFPCVIKPLSLSGSRGVIRVENRQALQQAAVRIDAILQQEGLRADERYFVLLEQYIPGYEYAYEGILHHGQLQRLTLFDKPDLMEGPFFEETYYITPSRLDKSMQDMIHDAVSEACRVYGLTEGPVHAEVRIHDNKVWFMEMASRTIGGQCAQVMEYATGLSLEQIVISNALGREIPMIKNPQAAGVLMIPIKKSGLLRRVEGILEASKLAYIEDIEISHGEGYELRPLPEGFSYLGFIFSRAPTPELAEQALRDAMNKLKIVTSPVLHST